jgi:hypothetical protein
MCATPTRLKEGPSDGLNQVSQGARWCKGDVARQMSQKRHADVAFHAERSMVQVETTKRGTNMASGPFEFAKYKRPHFEDRNPTSDRAAVGDTMQTEDLGDLLGRVSESSTTQIDNLVGDFGRLREKLRVDGERIQRDVEEYRALSEQVMQMTKTIAESVEKVRSSVDR